MRKYSFLLFLSLLVSGSLCAQLVNNGGTITIQPNAKLVVQSDVTNTTGTIVNSGTIEVEGDFTNAATVTSNSGSKLVFKGDSDSNFDSGGAVFTEVENNKTAGDVILTSAASVTDAVDFSGSSDIKLGNFDFELADGATSNGSASGHFVTDGMGFLVQKTDAAGTSELDLGDGTNYSPISIAHTGTYTAGTSEIKAQVDNTEHPDKLSDADDYLNRFWTVENNIATPSLVMTGTYVPADVTGTAGDMVGARYEAMDWEFGTGAQSGSTVSATTEAATSELTGMNFYGKANVKVFLDGPYNDATQLMATSLNDNDLIPNLSPYSDGKSVDAAFWNNSANDDIVDWIYLETRDNSSNITGGTSAFLESDGDIVSVDGTTYPAIKDAEATNYIVVMHRNHAPIATSTQVSLTDEALNDLSSSGTSAFGTNTRKVYAGTNKATMWAGDGFSNENVRFLGQDNDSDAVKNIVLGDAGNFFNILTYTVSDVYSVGDVNMDGDVKFLGGNNDNDVVKNAILDNPGNFFNILTYTITNTLP